MKYAVIALAAVALAGSASAAEKVTDVDYLKANRCKGLATSIHGAAAICDSPAWNRSWTMGFRPEWRWGPR